MPGRLFTEYFLSEGIQSTDEWGESLATPQELEAFREGLRLPYEALSRAQDPNEAATDQELILPVLELLGWADYLPQQGASENEDIPDYLLFPDDASKERAAARAATEERYRDAAVVEESKRFGLPLDAGGRDPAPRPVAPRGPKLFELPEDYGVARTERRTRTPHAQMLRYLSTAEIESDGRIRWGFLTNGRVWRLYDYRARPRATSYFEAYIDDMLQPGDEQEHLLRVFYLLFRRSSFVRQAGATTTFLEDAIAEGKRYEEQVAQDLSGVVFQKVFPGLVQALYAASNGGLDDVRQAALVLLYRLLFILYAEDRGLLPVEERGYRSYGLRDPVRYAIKDRMDDGSDFSTKATNYYDHVMTLCRLIDRGDPSIRLPPYNGGLFSGEAAPLLEQVRLPDAAFAPVVHDLSHAETAEGRRYVNYRHMSVQQLGSIYERLLEREPVLDSDGDIDIRPNPYARKDSGSFYTPQELVDLVIERTLGPLVEERRKAFEDRAIELGSDRRSKDVRQAELAEADPAEAVLELRVLDPAMGSGHFLVTAVDFLSDHIAELVEYPPEVEWLEDGYVSPLVERLAAIRKSIKRNRGPGRIGDDGAELTDLDIIRRMVLKRCIYGVDKNPMTVELAKVSLWLHSFTVGAPLSFLGPPPAPRRLAGGDAGARGRRGAEPAGRALLQLGHRGGRSGRKGDGADRGDVRRGRVRGARVGRAVLERRGGDGGPAGAARLPVRGALADRRDAEEGASGVREAAGGHARASRRRARSTCCRRARTPRARPKRKGRDAKEPLRGDVARREGRRRRRGLPALGGRISGGVAGLAGRPSGGRVRRGDRESALGAHQAAGGGMAGHPRPGCGSLDHRRRQEVPHQVAARHGLTPGR